MPLQVGSKAVSFRVLEVLISRENHVFLEDILVFGSNLTIIVDFGANLGTASARRKDGARIRARISKKNARGVKNS